MSHPRGYARSRVRIIFICDPDIGMSKCVALRNCRLHVRAVSGAGLSLWHLRRNRRIRQSILQQFFSIFREIVREKSAPASHQEVVAETLSDPLALSDNDRSAMRQILELGSVCELDHDTELRERIQRARALAKCQGYANENVADQRPNLVRFRVGRGGPWA